MKYKLQLFLILVSTFSLVQHISTFSLKVENISFPNKNSFNFRDQSMSYGGAMVLMDTCMILFRRDQILTQNRRQSPDLPSSADQSPGDTRDQDMISGELLDQTVTCMILCKILAFNIRINYHE